MTRRCSHCSNNGHNTRTCPTRGSGGGGSVKLFGVMLTDDSIMKKSASMGNLSGRIHRHFTSASSNPDSPLSGSFRDPTHLSENYLSDDPGRGDRKKGVLWTEEEHLQFLMGLEKLGKGNWRGIARNYVISRTPTQVASHAQKYFNRQNNTARKKRRSSLFDMVQADDMVTTTKEAEETYDANTLPSLNLSLNSEFETMETEHTKATKEAEETYDPSTRTVSLIPGLFPAHFHTRSPFSPHEEDMVTAEVVPQNQVVKPIQILRKEVSNVDEVVGMYRLRIGDRGGSYRSDSNLVGESTRQSGFHANGSGNESGLSKSHGGIQTVINRGEGIGV